MQILPHHDGCDGTDVISRFISALSYLPLGVSGLHQRRFFKGEDASAQ